MSSCPLLTSGTSGWLCHHTIAPIPPDLTLTPSNMSAVLHTVQDLERLGDYVLDLPHPVYHSIESSISFSHDDQRREALINHYLLYHPLATWAHLAGRLYWWEEHTALQEVRQYITQQTGVWKIINMYITFHLNCMTFTSVCSLLVLELHILYMYNIYIVGRCIPQES